MKKNLKLRSVILIAAILLISCLPATGQIDENFWKNRKKAYEASSPEEYQSSLKFCNEVLKVTPNHPIMNYLAARLNEQLGNSVLALKQLRKAAKLGYTSNVPDLKIHPMNDPAFDALRKKKEFQKIIEIMKVSDKSIHNSEIAFTVNKKILGKSGGYEGITFDPVEKIFYLGSDYIIVKVDHLGNSIRFTKEDGQDGLGRINGIHVDPVRRTLWACSNDKDNANGTIFKYDLSSGKLIKKYISPSDGHRHFFNDLVIHPNGDIFISGSAVYRIPHHSVTIEFFLKKPIFSSNGITLSDDKRSIFLATYWRLYKIDIETKSYALLTHEEDFNTYGIDGFYCKGKYLYAIPRCTMEQVCRFLLNKDATHLESCEIFEKNTPNLSGPTTGVFVDDYFYFIAGSNQEEVIVMKAPIK